MQVKAKGKRQKTRGESRKYLDIFRFLTFSVFSKFVLIAFCLLPFASQAQDTIKKPKIGLVLSGGGAKGLAHIGVLKVLEEAGIKIDYIGGTSMGAILGGLYASGYTANQLDSIFNATDYDAVLKDDIPRSSKNFYEKNNNERYALALPFRKFKIGVPAALSKGLYNYNLITRLSHHVRNQRDFTKLPIPFLCIATDIETGEEEVLKNGFLPQAVLASGAFPSLYVPIEINGKYLIDGGILNNFPVAEVKKMGADIIIGVDVQDDLKSRDHLQDATRILVQISNLQMIEQMNKNKLLIDIYIKPDIKDFSIISFEQAPEIIKRGQEAAYLVLHKLQELSSNYKTKQTVTAKKETDSLKIQNITLPELKNYTRAYILGKLRFKNNTTITYRDLKKGIENLNATGNFYGINYTIDAENDQNNIALNLLENPNKTYLKFGLHYDGLYKSGVLVNLSQKKLFFKNDVFSGDIILGDNFRYLVDYHIDNGFYWSIGLKSWYSSFNKNVQTDFNNGLLFSSLNINSINIDYSEFANQVYVQTVLAQKFIAGAGLELKHIKIKSETLQNTQPIFENSYYVDVFGYMKYDSFDNKFFPKEGRYFRGEVQSFLASSNYTGDFSRFSIFKVDMAIAKTFLKKLQ